CLETSPPEDATAGEWGRPEDTPPACPRIPPKRVRRSGAGPRARRPQERSHGALRACRRGIGGPLMRVLLDADGVERGLRRMAGELAERTRGTERLILVGIRRGGVP